MAVRMMRLSQVARKLNIGKNTIIEFLDSQGFKIEDNPNQPRLIISVRGVGYKIGS